MLYNFGYPWKRRPHLPNRRAANLPRGSCAVFAWVPRDWKQIEIPYRKQYLQVMLMANSLCSRVLLLLDLMN